MRPRQGVAAALALSLALGLAGAASASEALLAEACGGCHEAGPDGLSRIAGQRKTPEGWLMTIVRMRTFHGVDVSLADQAELVAHLSETQGMAPAETAPWRYALEKDPAAQEAVEEPLGTMCSRCHTMARVGLQRRTAAEWLTHMHFHVGQFPTTEYQALGRDRDWFRLATEEIAPLLAATYPLETPEWTAWKAAPKASPAGDWVVLTDIPGKGAAYGALTVAGAASPFEVTGALVTAAGEMLPVSGRMNLYTGYEWRAALTVGDARMRQVLAIGEDGATLSGRQFLAEQDSLGGRLTGAKAGTGRTIALGLVPEAAAPGAVTAQLVGVGVDQVAVAGGAATVAPNAAGAAVSLTGAAGDIAVIEAGDEGFALTFWDKLDRIEVEPAFTIARVGGGSDVAPPPVPAHFKAIGFWNGPDGQPGTIDDIRVGEVPAAWSVGDHDEIAAAMEDAKFAGTMDAAGIFTPAIAGPNPARPYQTNNAGDLKIAGAAGGAQGEARLIVTVQRFIDPPIR